MFFFKCYCHYEGFLYYIYIYIYIYILLIFQSGKTLIISLKDPFMANGVLSVRIQTTIKVKYIFIS